MQTIITRFYNDDLVQVVGLLVLLDLALGIVAGVVAKTFRLSYIADFARNDLLGKVLPLFLLYGGLVYAQGADIVIPGLDLEVVAKGASVIVIAALAGSLLNSVRDLKLLPAETPDEIAGPDPETPMPPQ